MTRHHEDDELDRAIWAGDVDKLQELAGCRCCCSEHTFGASCPAYAWSGCRGQFSEYRTDDPLYNIDSWARHYGMTRDQFLGYEG